MGSREKVLSWMHSFEKADGYSQKPTSNRKVKVTDQKKNIANRNSTDHSLNFPFASNIFSTLLQLEVRIRFRSTVNSL